MSYQHATHRTSLHKHSKYEADYAASDQMLPHDEQLISCEICIESVPVSEAQISEAGDYVAYFCGLECYELWITQSTANNK